MPFTPKILDLRENPRLTLIGKGALNIPGLETLKLPHNILFLDKESLPSSIRELEIESTSSDEVRQNFIRDQTEFFPSVCCAIGDTYTLTRGTVSFCDLGRNEPGADATFEPGIIYQDAPIVEVIDESGFPMSEADLVVQVTDDASVIATAMTDTNGLVEFGKIPFNSKNEHRYKKSVTKFV